MCHFSESPWTPLAWSITAVLLVAAAMGCGPAAVDPCDDVVCDERPDPECRGSTAVTYQEGVCVPAGDVGECFYDHASQIDCSSTGQVCEAGACVAAPVDLCEDVLCDDPPEPGCDGDVAVVYALSLGACDPDTGDCVYEEESRTDCAADDLYCDDGECVEPDPCEDVVCDDPPAPFCHENRRIEYAATGTCIGGTCHYETTAFDCEMLDQVCDAGTAACMDLCSGVSCDDPPANWCDNFTRVSYEATGTCDWTTGECAYEEERTNCALSQTLCDAATAECVDLCDGVVCDDPPASYCHQGIAYTYGETGECAWYSDGSCEYSPVPTNCAQQGQTCSGGVCVD